MQEGGGVKKVSDLGLSNFVASDLISCLVHLFCSPGILIILNDTSFGHSHFQGYRSVFS